MKMKWMALALAGLVWMGGSAMAMDVHVDSSTAGMKDKVASIPPGCAGEDTSDQPDFQCGL